MKKVLRKVVTVAMLVTMFSTAVNLCAVSAAPNKPQQQKVTSQHKLPSKPVKPPKPTKSVSPTQILPRITTSPTLPCISTPPRITTSPTLPCISTPPAIENLSISVGSISTTPNENIVIPVSFENIRDEIFVCNFDITYDPTQLKYISYDPQSIVPDATNNFEISKPTDGTLKVLFFDYKKLEQSIKFDGIIANLKFEVIGTSNAETSINISNVTVGNRDLKELTPDIKPGIVKIVGTATPPIVSPTPGSFEITVGSEKASTNEIISLPVYFDDIPEGGITTVDLSIFYDTKQLKYISSDSGNIVKNPDINFASNEEFPGKIRVLFLDYTLENEYINSNGIFAILNFKVIGNSFDVAHIKVGNVTIGDRELNSVETASYPGSVIIETSQTPIATFGCKIGSTRAFAGDVITIPVNFENVPDKGINHGNMTITYDPKKLRYMSCEAGSIVKNPDTNFASNEADSGIIKILFLDYTMENEYINSNGVFANLNFEVLGNPNEVTNINIEDITIGDTDLNPLAIEIYPGVVTIDYPQTPTSDFYCKIGSTQASAGDVITIPVNFENVSVDGIVACNMTITYDPEQLLYDDYNAGSIVENPYVNLAINNPSPGIIKVVFLDYTMQDEPINSSGVFANLIFKVLDTNDKSTEVNIVDSTFVNYDLNYIDSKVENGTISLIP